MLIWYRNAPGSPVLWLFLALGSAFVLGGYEVARKAAVHENAVLPVLLTANVAGLLFVGAGVSLVSVYPEVARDWGLLLRSLSGLQHAAVAFKAALVTASWVLAYASVKHLPISITGPLRATSPVVTVLGALVLFGEDPALNQWLGIIVIFAGYFAFALLGRVEGIDYAKNRWVGILVLGTCIGAMSGLYDKHLLQRMRLAPTTLQFWFAVYNVLLQSLMAWVLWFRRPERVPFRFRWSIPAVGILLVLADQLYFRALYQDEALVSVVALIRRTSVLVSFTIGGLLFRERLLRKKGAALVVVLVGLTLLFL